MAFRFLTDGQGTRWAEAAASCHHAALSLDLSDDPVAAPEVIESPAACRHDHGPLDIAALVQHVRDGLFVASALTGRPLGVRVIRYRSNDTSRYRLYLTLAHSIARRTLAGVPWDGWARDGVEPANPQPAPQCPGPVTEAELDREIEESEPPGLIDDGPMTPQEEQVENLRLSFAMAAGLASGEAEAGRPYAALRTLDAALERWTARTTDLVALLGYRYLHASNRLLIIMDHGNEREAVVAAFRAVMLLPSPSPESTFVHTKLVIEAHQRRGDLADARDLLARLQTFVAGHQSLTHFMNDLVGALAADLAG